MDQSAFTHLNGHSVLVKSTVDRSDPPVALRGTIEAKSGPEGESEVKIVLEYPDMNNSASRRGVIVLDRAGMDRLMAGEHDGVYEFAIDRPLELGREPRGPRAVT